MSDARTVKVTLGSTEQAVLTEIMCARGCSIEEAVLWLITKHGARYNDRSEWMREYMREYRKGLRRKRGP